MFVLHFLLCLGVALSAEGASLSQKLPWSTPVHACIWLHNDGIVSNVTLEECQVKCDSASFLCRSVEYAGEGAGVFAKTCWMSTKTSQDTVDFQKPCSGLFSNLLYSENIGTIHVMGGSKSGNKLNSVERYTETGWSDVQPMSTPRNRLTATVQDNLLYAIGGINKDQDGELNTVEMYNPRSGQWTSVSSMNTSRVMHGAAAMGGLVYVVGGWGGGTDLDTVEIYNVTSGQWKYGTSMTQPRVSSGVVELGGRIYAIGGWNAADGYLNNVTFMYKDSGVWSPAPSMNTRRSGPGAATLNTKIYVAGGYDDGSYLRSVEMFDPIENVWKNVASMRVARVGPALVSMGGKIWAMGGLGDDGSALSLVEVYSPETDTWEDGDNMESCAGSVAAEVINI